MKIHSAILLGLLLWSCNSLGIFRGVEPAPNRVTSIDLKGSSQPWQAFWIGHASVLLRIYDKFILTDPVFEERVGIAVKRLVAPSVYARDLPELSWALVSHLHFDHFDTRSLKKLNHNAALAVAPGVVPYMMKMPFEKVYPMQPWQVKVHDGVKVTAVPAAHFGGRYGFDGTWDTSSYVGYVIEYKDVTIYFAGDTGENDVIYKEIGQQFIIDLALIPMGPYRNNFITRRFSDVHLNPYAAVKAFAETGARYMMPIHHSTFYLRGGEELKSMKEAISNFEERDNIFLLDIGQSISYANGRVSVAGINQLKTLVTD